MVTPLPGPDTSLVGTVLARRWRLSRKLGEGGMGEVYAADAIEGGARAAVKLLRREFVGDPEVRARFLEEARTCMRLVHPNIVRVLECAHADDEPPYIVMELLDGVPLGAYMQNGARIPVAQAAPILHAILGGLAAAHANGVVHRDLKPDNVILSRDHGGAFVVKVVDFGIAKVMDIAGGMGNRTRTGMLLGTPAYMSPEQARSARDVDQRTDLWSAGVLFYEMLSGRVAFPAPTEYARLAALLSIEPEPLDRVDPGLAPLVPFLERALKKNRDERFPSAGEMARALAAAVPGSAARSGPSQPPEGTPEGRRRSDAPLREPPLASGINQRDAGDGILSPLSPAGSSKPERSDARTKAARSSGHPRGGTLASQHAAPAIDPVPQVLFVAPAVLGETLPSKDRPLALRRERTKGLGVAPKVVALFVVCALAIGLILGWLVSRMQ